MPQSLHHSSGPFQTCSSKTMSLFFWGAQSWTHHSRCAPDKAKQRRRLAHLPWPCGYTLPCATCVLLAAYAARSHSSLMFHLVSTRSPRAFTSKLLFSQTRPQPVQVGAWGFLLPKGRTWHFPLLCFRRFLLAKISSLSTCHWMAAQPSGASINPPIFVTPANPLRVSPAPSTKSLMKTVSSTGPSVSPQKSKY